MEDVIASTPVRGTKGKYVSTGGGGAETGPEKFLGGGGGGASSLAGVEVAEGGELASAEALAMNSWLTALLKAGRIGDPRSVGEAK